MIKGFKIPKVTFRIRTGDAVETDGGCAIGGEWHNATTDSYFKGKRVVIFSHRSIYPLVHHNNFQVSRRNIIKLKTWA